MARRDYILPSLTAFVVSCLFLFLSCANQDRVQDEGLDDLAEEVAESVGDELPEDAELEGLEDEGFASGEEDLGNLEGGEEGMEDMGDELGLPSEEELAQASEETPNKDQLPSDENLEETFNDVASTDDKSAASADDDLGDVLGLPSDAELAQAEKLEASAGNDISALEEEIGGESYSDSQVSTKSSTPRASWSGQSRIPNIPGQAFQKNGSNMNRFYFLRLGDSPESLSQLIYSTSNKASKLKSWNRGSWVPGKLVFYESNQNPNDQQMRSLYRERNITPQEYEIKRGDWLSLIAKKNLGHLMSWKELAVVNGMSSADAIEVGQRIAIYPADLRGSGSGQTEYSDSSSSEQPVDRPSVETMESAQATPPPVREPSKPAIQAESPVQFTPPPPVKQSVKKRVRRSRKSSKSGLNIVKIIEKNLFFIVVGSGILLLLGALVLVNRKKRARASEDFNDDIFGEQMKK